MSTKPRISSAIEGQGAEFVSVLAHSPHLAERFFDLYGEFWQNGVVDQRTKEITRIRNARVTDCGFCKRVRFDGARGEGLDEDEVNGIEDGFETRFGDRETAALELTDAIIGDPRRLSGATKEKLHEHFSDEQIAELGIGVGLFIGLAKVLITLGLEPEDMPVTVVPTPGAATG